MADVRIESLTVEQIGEFRRLLINNAQALHADALVLLQSGAHARSHSLALLGFEELAKLLPLWSLRLDPEEQQDTDWNYLRAFMKAHNDKIAVALFMEYLLEAIFGIEHQQHCLVVGMTPMSVIEGEARRLNLLKQGGFYVEFDGIRFLGPSESVTVGMATVIVARLKRMLEIVSLFDRLAALPNRPTREQLLEARRIAQSVRL